MQSKTILNSLTAVLLLAAFPALGLAQNIGLRTGIAQPPVVTPPTHGPAVAVRNPFTGAVVIIQPVQPVPRVITPIDLVPRFPTVIIPNQVLVPGQTIVPAQPVIPQPVFTPPATFQPGGPAVPPARPTLPVPGTPRSEVLERFGRPLVTVVTSTGETLYFNDGIKVLIQNGQVAGPN